MTDYRRPSAREIVEAVVQAMHEAHEPLDEGVVLVPSIYDVMIHPSAYRQLEPILGRIHSQATQRLERELERLNRSSGWVAGRVLRPLLRLFYADHRLRRLGPGGATVERAGGEWVVDILITADPSAKMDFLAVETDFGGRVSPVMRGDTGLDVRRRTTRLAGGGYETILVTPRDGLPSDAGRSGETEKTPERPPARDSDATGETMAVPREEADRTREASRPTEASHPTEASRPTGSTPRPTGDGAPRELGPAHAAVVAAAEALAHGAARLDYEDREGRHTIYMEKPRIVIGRGEDADVKLVTQADVSREHVVIRRSGGGFEIKNVGRYGTRLNGSPLEPTGDWYPLPDSAEIILADAVSVRFSVLS